MSANESPSGLVWKSKQCVWGYWLAERCLEPSFKGWKKSVWQHCARKSNFNVSVRAPEKERSNRTEDGGNIRAQLDVAQLYNSLGVVFWKKIKWNPFHLVIGIFSVEQDLKELLKRTFFSHWNANKEYPIISGYWELNVFIALVSFNLGSSGLLIPSNHHYSDSSVPLWIFAELHWEYSNTQSTFWQTTRVFPLPLFLHRFNEACNSKAVVPRCASLGDKTLIIYWHTMD